MSANTTTGTIAITPRLGTSSAAPSGSALLGASVAKIYGTTFVSQPWWMDFSVAFLSVSKANASAGVIGGGIFVCTNATSANNQVVVCFGGTLGTCDPTVQQGIAIGVALSSATMTTHYAFIQSIS